MKELSLEVTFTLQRRNWRFTDFAPVVMYTLRERFVCVCVCVWLFVLVYVLYALVCVCVCVYSPVV
jgi:hypothetical protein